jgi:hypothetical protein
MKHHLSSDQLRTLAILSEQGRTVEAWRLLGQWGDTYARQAASIVGQPQPGEDRRLHDIVQDHWLNTVGRAEYVAVFQSVARRHFTQYLQLLQDGYWPDSDQIVNSYLTAARLYLLPDIAVFDSVWLDSGAQRFMSWEDAVNLAPGRRVSTPICTSTPTAAAMFVIGHDLLDLLF